MCKLVNFLWDCVVFCLALIGLGVVLGASGLLDPPRHLRPFPELTEAAAAPVGGIGINRRA